MGKPKTKDQHGLGVVPTDRYSSQLFQPGGSWPAGFLKGTPLAFPFGVLPPPFTWVMVGAIRSSSCSIWKGFFCSSSRGSMMLPRGNWYDGNVTRHDMALRGARFCRVLCLAVL